MTTQEVCDYLEISHDTLMRRRKQGRIRPLPRTNPALDREPLRFLRADVEALKAGRPSPDGREPQPPPAVTQEG